MKFSLQLMNILNDFGTDVFIFQDVLAGSAFIYLGISSAFRKWQHAEAATQPIYFYTQRLKAKITLNAIIILFYISVFVFLLLNPEDHLVDSMKYVLPFPIIALILESDLLLFQYARGISSKISIHGFTWVCLTFFALITLITYLAAGNGPNDHAPDLYICLLEFALFTSRAGVQLYFPQDNERLGYTESEETLVSTNRIITLDVGTDDESDKSLSRSLLGDRHKKNNSLGFSTSIKSAKKVNGEYQFQINVSTGKKTYKILKTYAEFKELHELLRDHATEMNKSIELPKFGALNASNVPQAIMQLQKYLENTLHVLDPVPDSILNFLKIIREVEPRNDTSPKKIVPLGNKAPNEANINLHDTLLTTEGVSSDRQGTEELKEEEGNNDFDKDFCPYIMVCLIDSRIPSGSKYYEYTFKLALSDNPEDNWYITKRYREFSQLAEALMNRKVKPPKLPPARIMKSQKVVEERKIGLTRFLQVLLNEEIYLKCEEVTHFVQLPGNLQKLFLQSREKFDFSNWWVRVVENRVKILPNNLAVTEFVILVTMGTADGSSASQYKIYKRMMDFDDLYSALGVRFGKEALPQLPAKFNSFFTQTTVEFRMAGLESFLNAIFKIEDIEDCFAFRKFMNAPVAEMQMQRSRMKRLSANLDLRASKSRESSFSDLEDQSPIKRLDSLTDELQTAHQLRLKNSEVN